jgi:hypothetical protein
MISFDPTKGNSRDLDFGEATTDLGTKEIMSSLKEGL